MRIRLKLAYKMLGLANLIYPHSGQPGYKPLFRPIDTCMEGIGHKFSCGAYSYEGLKSLVEQDGPDGFGAKATVKWLIGTEGWKNVSDMSQKELRRNLAMSGIDMEERK